LPDGFTEAHFNRIRGFSGYIQIDGEVYYSYGGFNGSLGGGKTTNNDG
jgi:hypothetical protein